MAATAQPFTSADVKFSAEEVWKPLQNLGRSRARQSRARRDPRRADGGVRVLRAHTPRTHRERAAGRTRRSCPRTSTRARTSSDPASPLNQQLVGTGPYLFAEHRARRAHAADPNPNYSGGASPTSTRSCSRCCRTLPPGRPRSRPRTSRLTVFSARPAVGPRAARCARRRRLPRTTGYEGSPYQVTLDFNHRNPILADVKVRKAIRQAIDPSFVVDTIFLRLRRARRRTGPSRTGHGLLHGRQDSCTRSTPAAAEAALDAAGYPRGADGTRFSLRLRPAPFFPETRRHRRLRQAGAGGGRHRASRS